MYTKTLLDVFTDVMQKHLFLGICCDDDTYLIDPRTIILYENAMAGKSVSGDMEFTIPYAVITAIEGVDVEPDVDEYGSPQGIDCIPRIRYCKINDKPLKFNKILINYNLIK